MLLGYSSFCFFVDQDHNKSSNNQPPFHNEVSVPADSMPLGGEDFNGKNNQSVLSIEYDLYSLKNQVLQVAPVS